ncbi:MAG: stalk domain-containing protein, partial [Selenomonadaceae bacterium]
EYPGQEGESIRALMKGLQKGGSPPEAFYNPAYVTGSLQFATPSTDALRVAIKHLIGEYVHLLSVEEILLLIERGIPVPVGIIAMRSLFTDHIQEMPNGTIAGGHGILLIDYDMDLVMRDHKGWFLFQNSWDTTWGDGGFGWISFDYLRCVDPGMGGMPYLLDAFGITGVLKPKYDVTKYTNQSKTVYMDGTDYILDQPAIIDPVTNRMLLPMRSLAEILGLMVEWDQSKAEATLLR